MVFIFMSRDNFSFVVLMISLLLMNFSFVIDIGWVTTLIGILTLLVLLIYAYVKKKTGSVIFVFILLIIFCLVFINEITNI